jgi:hypothetical protein
MDYKYFVEFLGVLVLLYTHFFTHANPYAMGIATFAVYKIGESVGETYFSPLTTTIGYFLGRLGQTETIYLIISQCVAIALILVVFKPLTLFIKNG